jgi:6-phosphogluconolactonase
MYVLTELHNTVLVYKYNGGDIKFLQEISTLPADFTGKSTAAAIHIPPNGRFLAASNRGHDSIAVFKIQDDGGLVFLYYINDCKEPRDFRFSPDGKWLLTANQNDDSVTVFPTGFFVPAASVKIPKPVCILFGEEIK